MMKMSLCAGIKTKAIITIILMTFLALFESGQLTARFDDEYHTQAEFLNDLSNQMQKAAIMAA